MRAYLHACVHVCIGLCTHARLQACTYVRIWAYTYESIYSCVYESIRAYMCVCANTNIHANVHVIVRACAYASKHNMIKYTRTGVHANMRIRVRASMLHTCTSCTQGKTEQEQASLMLLVGIFRVTCHHHFFHNIQIALHIMGLPDQQQIYIWSSVSGSVLVILLCLLSW